MLPLILLGVYKTVHGEGIWKLTVPMAVSILANWYSGGINCLFSAFWFVLEVMLMVSEKKLPGETVKLLLKAGVRYAVGMLLAFACSSVLFLPTIAALQNSSRGNLQIELLKQFTFMGDISSVIQSYTYGAESTKEKVSLYCGALALIGCIGCFCREGSRKRKTILGIGLGLTILFFYWTPFYVLFSFFKSVGSYWSRYSYIGIMSLLFLAAHHFISNLKCDRMSYLRAGLLYVSVLICLQYVKPEENQKYIYYTAAVIIAVSGLLQILQELGENVRFRNIICVGALAFVVIGDLTYSTIRQMNSHHTSDVAVYEEYVESTQQQIAGIKDMDQETFRISQTSTRNMRDDNLTANYNEALSFSYFSISGYTSSPDDIQREFLDRVGYRINGGNMCIVNTSILGADSLMGVKYILSEYPINGLAEEMTLGEHNGKKVYRNPYCLPMVFTYPVSDVKVDDSGNPFVYQNELYSQLLGREVKLYLKTDVEVMSEGTTETGESRVYQIKLPEGRYALYGNIPWNSEMNAMLHVNGYYETGYSKWLSPAVFYIPYKEGDETVTIELSAETSYNLKAGEEQFYAMDLGLLEDITEELRTGAVSEFVIENGYIYVEADAEAGENLLLAVPYDRGWIVELNGHMADTELFGDCFYVIPMKEGRNVIEMHYSLPWRKEGILISVIGVALLAGISGIEKGLKAKTFWKENKKAFIGREV